jgi:dephospho-CoA kinase
MVTIVILYGPKAVGKSAIAECLQETAGVRYLDADVLVLDLLSRGERPDPQMGWLSQVEQAVEQLAIETPSVSVEATGAWESDWQLARDLMERGHRVITVWVWVPKHESLSRLAKRTIPRVFVSQEEASWIHDAATARAAQEYFDLRVDTSTAEAIAEAVASIQRLL